MGDFLGGIAKGLGNIAQQEMGKGMSEIMTGVAEAAMGDFVGAAKNMAQGIQDLKKAETAERLEQALKQIFQAGNQAGPQQIEQLIEQAVQMELQEHSGKANIAAQLGV